MPAWMPALKAVLPYVTNLVTAAIPAFTARKGQERVAELTAKQIAELQDAATHNAEAVKVLAQALRRAYLIALAAVAVALAALAVALVGLVR